MHKLAIFASGSGTNAENIIRYFQNEPQVSVSCVCTNRPDACVIQRARNHEIPVFVFSKEEFHQTEVVVNYLIINNIEWIVLAGFLWLIPDNILQHFSNRIINIHPALLPKHGGKGMYGNRVHQAVIDQKESLSGITVHYVNPEYDKGRIIFQATCPVFPGDTAETLAARIHELEYRHFPEVIKQEILKG